LVPPPKPYVSRGGTKLAGALARFPVPVAGLVALDAGSSTGGFTDCLLQHGAARVVAVELGRNQLHERLRADPRVDLREQTDVRAVTIESIGGPVALVVADLSSIPLRTMADAVLALAAPAADLVLLVKPQYEAEAAEAARGRGVIADPAIWRRALLGVIGTFDGRRAAIMGVMPSPLRGADGNVEFFVHVRAPGASAPTAVAVDHHALVDAALAEVEAGT
jgi:23S rRNA (cytidine1920-2'-O)/16S rRNA (cytidine1409-2'-O)-methyltransferase